MKKLYFLCFLLITAAGFGQNLVANGGFETWTAGVPDSYTTIDFNTTDLSENTDAAFVSEGSSSARVNVLTQDQGSTDIRQDIALTGGVTYNVSLDVYATNNEARARIFNGTGFDPSVYSDETLLNQWQTISFEYTPATDETFNLGIRFYDIAANWTEGTQSSLFYIDNFKLEASVNPEISVISPSEGATLASADVDVEISVQNFTVANGGSGDGYIQYTVDGGTTIDKFDVNTISLSSLSEGSHTVELELVDNSGQALTPVSTTSVTFTITSLNQVADLAALRAGTIGEIYELTSEATITYIVTEGNRNQKYIQDGTAGILIDDPAGVITTAFNIGDGITGLQGQLSEYSNVLQFVPVENVAAASSTGNTVTPQVLSVQEFLADGEAYESELIKIDNVVFNVSGQFEDNTNYEITGSGATNNMTIARVSFGDENLVGATIPTTASSVIGLGAQFNDDYQILPRYVTDVEGATLSVAGLEAELFSVYPNPTATGFVNIKSKNNAQTTVSVFDILGKQVMTQTLSNDRLNVSALNNGVYILKISQNNTSVTKKLVIK